MSLMLFRFYIGCFGNISSESQNDMFSISAAESVIRETQRILLHRSVQDLLSLCIWETTKRGSLLSLKNNLHLQDW